MPVHSLASLLTHASVPSVIGASSAVAVLVGVKAWAGGRKCTWERDWAGKMILVVVSCSHLGTWRRKLIEGPTDYYSPDAH